MITEISQAELMQACRVLFDYKEATNPEFFNTLDFAALKLAYRKKALETHPDRSRMLGISESVMSDRFKQVTSAYELLSPLINGKKKINRPDRTKSHHHTAPRKPYNRSQTQKHQGSSPFQDRDNRFYTGQIPRHELLIGQFLYYSGLISWQRLINAIVWQRRQRPLFGEIAYQWGILTEEEIKFILEQRHFREKIGQYAIRTGLITPFQHMAIMGKQRRLQVPIGKYFTEHNLISTFQMNRMIMEMKHHNQLIKNKK